MISSRGKFLFDSFKSSSIFSSVRFSSLPQSVTKSKEYHPVLKEKENKESFIKNIFLGAFDGDFLAFPRHKQGELSSGLLQFKELVKSNEDDRTENYEKLKFFAENGFFRYNIPDSYGGVAVENSELIKFYEELDLDPALAVLLEIHTSLIIPTLLKYGSSEQKERLLGKLLNGEITGAYALSEYSSGFDPTAMKSCAEEQEDTFILNGEKIWVTNAKNADLFLVFAPSSVSNLRKSTNELTNYVAVFLVDRTDSINIEDHDLIGLMNSGIGKVKFYNHSIPKNNLINELNAGFKIAAEGISSPKYIILSSVLNCLKKLISSLFRYINTRKKYPQNLKECELVKNRVFKITSVAYCLESMLYFCGDISDRYVIDTSLESVLLQVYGMEKGLEAINSCIELLGSRAYDKTFEYEKVWCDMKGLSLFVTPSDIARIYVALIGLDHAGKNFQETVIKNRNPFNFPGYALKKLLKSHRFSINNKKLTLKLYMNLHPSLKSSAEKLELCVLQFQHAVEILLSRHGSEIVNRQLDLKRLSNIVLEIFAMTSVLSRASHSYCTGIQFSDHEVIIAQSICFESFKRAKENIEEILASDIVIQDGVSANIGSVILDNKSYLFKHPLEHCI